MVSFVATKAEQDGNVRVANHVHKLASAMQAHLELPPFYRILAGLPTAPCVNINEDGRILYKEVSTTYNNNNSNNFIDHLIVRVLERESLTLLILWRR